jgi:Protein of unknown function (DUF2004)
VPAGPLAAGELELALVTEARYEGETVMAAISHPILGKLDPARPGSWNATLMFSGREITIDLSIDRPGLTEQDLQGLPQQPADLVALDRAARDAILSDADPDDDDAAFSLYISHHESELPVAELQRLFGTEEPSVADPEAMLARLMLVRVGLHPEHEDRFIVFDYSIDPDVTNYVLSVSFDGGGEPIAVDVES